MFQFRLGNHYHGSVKFAEHPYFIPIGVLVAYCRRFECYLSIARMWRNSNGELFPTSPYDQPSSISCLSRYPGCSPEAPQHFQISSHGSIHGNQMLCRLFVGNQAPKRGLCRHLQVASLSLREKKIHNFTITIKQSLRFCLHSVRMSNSMTSTT